ncbi:MAG: hypothetical protein AABO57_18105 [Acidobacteriota bacterium]
MTGTFSADRLFCDRLFASANAHKGAEILVYYHWANEYLPHCQQALFEQIPIRFGRARQEMAELWTGILMVALWKDINLIPYLALRGVLSEAGTVLRRGLESTGVLAHIWRDPAKVEALAKGPKSKEYRRAFGFGNRFEAFETNKAASLLYDILSSFDVHGGTGSQLTSSSLTPTEFSCLFINRRDPEAQEVSGQLEVLSKGYEMICLEVALISKDFGTHSPEMTNAAQDLKLLLEDSVEVQSEMEERVRTLLAELGCNRSE